MSATGDNIRRLRESHGMTQADIAKIAGVTDKAVSTWENGLKIPRMGALEKIAAYFGVTKSALVDDADITKRDKPLSAEAMKIAAAYDRADDKSRDMVLLALKEYLADAKQAVS